MLCPAFRGLFSLLVLLSLALTPLPARALFHVAVISEVLTSYDGDDSIQFIEIEMLFVLQNVVGGSVIARFDRDGVYLDDVIVLPLPPTPQDPPVPNHGVGVTYLLATQAFVDRTSLDPEFIIPATLPTSGGMICFGGGGGVLPLIPPDWDRDDLDSYVDCLAYGDYSGPTGIHSGDPTPLVAVGHSLKRISETEDNLMDFRCGDPLTPTNNFSESAPLRATELCPEPAAALAQLAALGTIALVRRRRA